MSKIISKLNFVKSIDELKILIWIWNKRKPENYKAFKRLLLVLNIILSLVYFISAFPAYMLLVLMITYEKQSFAFYLIYTSLTAILIYIAYISLMLIRKKIFSSYNLVIFNLEAIKRCKSYESLKNILPDLSYEIEKEYKKNDFRRIIVPYIIIINSINLKNKFKELKEFFKDFYTIFKNENDAEILDKIIGLDNKIKKNKTYKNLMRYYEAISGYKKEDNLYSYLTKIYDYEHKKRLLIKIKFAITNTIKEIFNKYIVFIPIIIFLILLYIFKKELFQQIIGKIVEKNLKIPP